MLYSEPHSLLVEVQQTSMAKYHVIGLTIMQEWHVTKPGQLGAFIHRRFGQIIFVKVKIQWLVRLT